MKYKDVLTSDDARLRSAYEILQKSGPAYNTRASNLFNLFWGDTIESYKIIIDGIRIPGFFHIGNRHIFTTNRNGDIDPDKGCVELVAVDNTRHDNDTYSQSLLINSYYDEPSVRDKCQTTDYRIDHVVMFKAIDLLAYEIELPYIKLVDGSRKLLPGCPWNLRVLNRLLNPEKNTFYEKFGFTTKVETILPSARGAIFPRNAYQYLSDKTLGYMSQYKLSLVEDLVAHMYKRCLMKRPFNQYISLETDIIQALEQSNEMPVGSIENKTYTKVVEHTHRCTINVPDKEIVFTKLTGGNRKTRKRKLKS
jgi:hypothetical protein